MLFNSTLHDLGSDPASLHRVPERPPPASEAALPRQLHGEGGFATSPAFLQTEGSADNILLKYSASMYLVSTNHREKYAY